MSISNRDGAPSRKGCVGPWLNDSRQAINEYAPPPPPVYASVSFGGKLHIGFVDIRNKLDSIIEEREAKRLKRREEEEKVGGGGGGGDGGWWWCSSW